MKRTLFIGILLLTTALYALSSLPDIAVAGIAADEGVLLAQSTGGSGGGPSTGGGGGGPSEGTNPDCSGGLFDPICKSVKDIFLAILDIIMVFAVPIVLFFIVWAGFLYVTARGNEAQLEKATRALTYAVVGGLLVLGAKVLLEVITNTIEVFTN